MYEKDRETADPWGEYFRRITPEKKEFRVQSAVPFESVLEAAGCGPPCMEWNGRWAWAAVAEGKAFRKALRYWWRCHEPSWAGVQSMGFAVAPEKWEPEMEKAFGLSNPPTPYEVSSVLLRRSWVGGIGRHVKEREGRMALMWWLAGMPGDALTDVVSPSWAKEAAAHIRWRMTRPKFGLWALSRNLLPIATDIKKAKTLASIYIGKKPVGQGGRGDEGTMRGLWEHPFTQGLRTRPEDSPSIPRALPWAGMVWENVEAKQQWLEEGVGTKAYWKLQGKPHISYAEHMEKERLNPRRNQRRRKAHLRLLAETAAEQGETNG